MYITQNPINLYGLAMTVVTTISVSKRLDEIVGGVCFFYNNSPCASAEEKRFWRKEKKIINTLLLQS